MTGGLVESDRVRTQRYQRLLRAYPRAWRDADGAALLGTMLDRAEARGRSSPTLIEVLDTTRNGLAAHATQALPPSTRDLIGSTAVGLGLGFTMPYFLAYSWIRGDFYTGTVMAGPVWFLPAWLLVAAAAWSGRRLVRIAAAAIAATTVVAVPILQPGPFFSVPWQQSGVVEVGTNPEREFAFLQPGQVVPPSAATISLLLFLALLSLSGAPSSRLIRRSSAITALAASAVFGSAVWLTPWPDYFTDRLVWTWPFDVNPSGISPLIALLTLGCLAATLALHRSNRSAATLAALGALALVTINIAFAISPPVGIGL